jgi:uncharacterized delta-60 repeat protein
LWLRGRTQNANQPRDAFISRYNADGTVDTTYGTNGVTFLDLGADDIATGVVIDGDGKAIICGVTGNLAQFVGDFFVARYNADGTLDNTFNSAGTTPGVNAIDFGETDAASDLKIQGDRIVVVGTSVGTDNDVPSKGGVAIAFVNLDGTLSSKTHTDLDTGKIDVATAVALSEDGGFVVSGFHASLTVKVGTFGDISVKGTSQFMAEFLRFDGHPKAIGDNGRCSLALVGRSNWGLGSPRMEQESMS